VLYLEAADALEEAHAKLAAQEKAALSMPRSPPRREVAMTDTPITDAALIRDKMILTEVGLLEIVDAGTARQLERELAQAKADYDALLNHNQENAAALEQAHAELVAPRHGSAKPREQVARFVEMQFEAYGGGYRCPLEKGRQWHYGKQDVRALLDFIYDGPPQSPEQEVVGKNLRNR
jgi:hypothetical protein